MIDEEAFQRLKSCCDEWELSYENGWYSCGVRLRGNPNMYYATAKRLWEAVKQVLDAGWLDLKKGEGNGRCGQEEHPA